MAQHHHSIHSSSVEESTSLSKTPTSLSTQRLSEQNSTKSLDDQAETVQFNERGDKPSASGAEAYSLCKAKFILEKGIPDTRSEVAEKGDRIHLWLEDETKIVLDTEELELARRCEDKRNSLLSLYFPDWQDSPVRTVKEQRLWFGRRRMSGKADFIAIKGGTALILDYKTGRIPVTSPKENKQLLWLAVLVAEKFIVDEVIVGVIQPLCDDSPAHRYTLADLKKERVGITKILRDLEKGTSKPVAGQTQCQYCKAKQVCPALNKAALKVVKPLELTNDLVSRQLSVVMALEDWCCVVKARAKEMLIANPTSIPNYTLRNGAVRRYIKDNVLAVKELVKAGIFTQEQVIALSSISVTTLENELIDFGGSRADAKRSINTALAGLLAEKQGEPQLMGVKR